MSELTDDIVAIGQLQARYADVISRRAFPELAELFRPDIVVAIDTVTRPEQRIVGPGDFGAFVGTAIERYDHFTFVILNAVVDVDGDEATGRIFMCEVRHDRAQRLLAERARHLPGPLRPCGRTVVVRGPALPLARSHRP